MTASFDAPVTGVTAAHFNGGTDFPVETGVSYAVTGGPTDWVLTATYNETPRASKALTFTFADPSATIGPPAQPSAAPLTLTYEPPTPTFSSTQGATGATVTDSVVTFTATFDHGVAGVAAGDFNVASTNGGVTWTETVTKKDVAGKVWEMAVAVSGGFADTDFSVTMADNSGVIDRPNAGGTNNGFALLCTCAANRLRVTFNGNSRVLCVCLVVVVIVDHNRPTTRPGAALHVRPPGNRQQRVRRHGDLRLRGHGRRRLGLQWRHRLPDRGWRVVRACWVRDGVGVDCHRGRVATRRQGVLVRSGCQQRLHLAADNGNPDAVHLDVCR